MLIFLIHHQSAEAKKARHRKKLIFLIHAGQHRRLNIRVDWIKGLFLYGGAKVIQSKLFLHQGF